MTNTLWIVVTYTSALIFALVTSCMTDSVGDTEHMDLALDRALREAEVISDEDAIIPRPFTEDVEFLQRLLEKRKWQLRTFQSLETARDCPYSYRDVALRLMRAPACRAPSSYQLQGPEGPWMEFDIDEVADNRTAKHPYPCSLRTAPENATGGVQVVNASECLRILEKEPEVDGQGASKQHCALVLFFSRSCPFSVKMAPEFNALGRAFPGVDVIAVDVSQSSGLYTRYGIVAVPDILLFHRRKPVLRFNYTERSYENLAAFLYNNTGIEAKAEVQVSLDDKEGPLPSILVAGPNYLLWFSNAFVILFACHLLKQRLGESILHRFREYTDYARQVWRTGEFYEQVGALDNEDGGFG